MKLFDRKNIVILLIYLIFVVMINCQKKGEKNVPITTSSDKALVQFKEGRIDFYRFRFFEAIEHFKNAIKEDPDFAMAYYYLAHANRFAGSASDFYNYLEQAVKLVDRYIFFPPHKKRGQRDFINNLKKAVALVDKVSEGEKLIILSAYEGSNANYKKENELLRELVDEYPDDKWAHYMLGNYYFTHRKYGKAIEEFEKSINIDPEFIVPYNHLGYAYSYIGNNKKAKEIFRKYISLLPDEPNPYDSLAELLMKEGKYEESIETYRKALSVDSTFYLSYKGIGINLIFMGREEDARDMFEEYNRFVSGEVLGIEVFYLNACSYVNEGRDSEAVNEIQKSIDRAKSNKDYMSVIRNLRIMIDILLDKGKISDAKDRYREAQKILEESNLKKDIKENYGISLLAYKAKIEIADSNFENAFSTINKFSGKAEFSENPEYEKWYHYLLGAVYLKEGKYDEVIKNFERADKFDIVTVYKLARAHEKKGNLDIARDLFEEVINYNRGEIRYLLVRKKAMRKLRNL